MKVAALALFTGLVAVAPATGSSAAVPHADATATASVAHRAVATSSASRAVRLRLRRAVAELPVAAERRRGYDRDKFRHWADADGDCQDTRDEVLDAESLTEVSGCDITAGEWRSYYDGRTWTSSSDVDIDHLVPLAEAWDSGARRWTAGTRKRYANDLHDRRTLVAVTDDVNQSKADRDPADWMPAQGRCRYVREWVAVKLRWRLSVHRPEKRTLRRLAGDCRDTVVRVDRARVVMARRAPRAPGAAGSGGI